MTQFKSISGVSVLLIALLGCCTSYSQSIAFFADVMINADSPEHRKVAAESFELKIADELAAEGSFYDSFEELPWISIQYPSDSSFRILSWQIDLGDGQFNYGGLLQTPINIFNFDLQNGRSSINSNDEFPMELWNGALVYKILTIGQHQDLYYLLSFAQIDEFTKVKTVEPLRFISDRPVLGYKNHFNNDVESRALNARVSIKYSVDSNAGFVYDDESQRLVYDNLVLVQGRMPGQGPTFVPDGSYKAFELDSTGSWSYVDKIFDQWNEGPLDVNGRKKIEKGLFKKKN